jgi:hypothetical protein
MDWQLINEGSIEMTMEISMTNSPHTEVTADGRESSKSSKYSIGLMVVGLQKEAAYG